MIQQTFEADIFLSNLGNVGLIELVRCARHFTIWEHSVVIGLQEVDKLVDKRLKVSFIVSADVGQSSSKKFKMTIRKNVAIVERF